MIGLHGAMSDNPDYRRRPGFAASAHESRSGYHVRLDVFAKSGTNHGGVLGQAGPTSGLTWSKPFTLGQGSPELRREGSARCWFADGELNVAVNCLDRHLAKRPEQTASCGSPTIRTNRRGSQLSRAARARLASSRTALKRLGVKKGDRVTIYNADDPETAMAMLACARIGAVHFGRVRRLLPRH
jgi:hypothetical protein